MRVGARGQDVKGPQRAELPIAGFDGCFRSQGGPEDSRADLRSNRPSAAEVPERLDGRSECLNLAICIAVA